MSRSLANTDASWRGVFSPSGGSLGQTNFQAASGAWPGIISIEPLLSMAASFPTLARTVTKALPGDLEFGGALPWQN